jgi:hypothetical protein
MGIGFSYVETLRGSYHTLHSPGDEFPMSLSLHLEVPDVARYALDGTARIEGEIDAAGLAERAPFRGVVVLEPLKARATYDFRFDVNGREHRFHGTREVDLLRPARSATTLPGRIYRDEQEIARAVLRFDVREGLLELLRTVRPV